MAKMSRGKCIFCNKEFTNSSMLAHVLNCPKRPLELYESKEKNSVGHYTLSIHGKHNKAYWIVVEFREDATLNDVDSFLRDIWLECCGHLSSFQIYGDRYESDSDAFIDWNDTKGMDYKLSDVLQEGMTVSYEYDFGSTTCLTILVFNYWEHAPMSDRMLLMSRNNPIVYMCGKCGKHDAIDICLECMPYEDAYLCKKCGKKHECGEEMLMPICNSPRTGVCGYAGSLVYPD